MRRLIPRSRVTRSAHPRSVPARSLFGGPPVMRLFSRPIHGVAIACIVATPSVLPAQNPPLRVLSRMELEYAEPFSCVSGLRELSDGRLIVSDVREKTVQLIDLKKGTSM